MTRIHPTAIIDPTAELADSVEVGPYTVIGPRVRVDEDCVFRSHVHVTALTRIGRGNDFHSFTIVGGDPQDLKYHGETTWLEIGDYNTVREHATIHRGTGNGGGITRIGSHNLIMGNVHIAHDCVIGNHCIFANNAMLAGHVHVEDYANIGGGAGLHHFVRVGFCSFVGAMARVSKDISPFMLVEGSPATARAYNHIGMSRLGLPESELEAAKDCYKRLFRARGGSVEAKVAALLKAWPDSKVVRRVADAAMAASDGVHGRSLEHTRKDDKRTRRAER